MTQNVINTSSVLLQSVTTSIATVVTCSTAIPSDNSIPQNTEGDQVLSLSITPRFLTSKLEIFFTSVISSSGTGFTTSALFQDSNANAISANTYNMTTNNSVSGNLRYFMTSGTTSATTFKVRVGNSALTAYVNADTSGNQLMGGVSSTRLTINEYI